MYPKTGRPQKGRHYHDTIRKWRWCNFSATWVQGIKIAKRPLNLVLSFPHTCHFPHPFYLPSSSSSHTYLKTDPSFLGKPSPSPALAPWSSLPWSDPSAWPSCSNKACHRPVTSLTLCASLPLYLVALVMLRTSYIHLYSCSTSHNGSSNVCWISKSCFWIWKCREVHFFALVLSEQHLQGLRSKS